MEPGFVARCSEVRERIASFSEPLVVNHYDCDGLAAAAITCLGLQGMGMKFRVRTVRKLDAPLVDELRAEKEVIFVDLAGASKDAEALNAVVIDHHQTEGTALLQANPHLFGMDGGNEISASGVAYCVFGTGAELAIVGAVGDMEYPLTGANREILGQGIAQGKLACETGLRLYGRSSRPLAQMLLYADEPYLPGLTGNEDACYSFLASTGIGLKARDSDKWRTYYDLDDGERKLLVSALAEYLAERGMPDAGKALVGEAYLLPEKGKGSELYDAAEFSTMLNACGRNRRPELGIAICLGDAAALEEGRKLLAEHKRNLRNGVEFAVKNAQDFGKFMFIDGRGVIDDGIIGVVAGMLYSGAREKPVIAVANDEKGEIKVSSRAAKNLVAAGLNLGAVLKAACSRAGGVGGGHAMAAGATVPGGNLDLFLRELGKEL
jgi:RecJ-like exonuclease